MPVAVLLLKLPMFVILLLLPVRFKLVHLVDPAPPQLEHIADFVYLSLIERVIVGHGNFIQYFNVHMTRLQPRTMRC